MLEKLGIDVRLLVWQMINFVILFLILRRFAWKPLVAGLKKRSATIEQSLRDAAAAAAGREAADRDRAAILAEARRRASEIITAAESDSSHARAEVVARAETEAQTIVTAAKAAAASEHDRVLSDARHELAGLVTAATARILEDVAPDIKVAPLVERVTRR